jgi:hypothetical protein
MKPKIKYLISINRNKQGQFFWTVRSGNSNKTGTPGESHVRKSHAIKMAKSLLLPGFIESSIPCDKGTLYLMTKTDEYRLLIDNTKK